MDYKPRKFDKNPTVKLLNIITIDIFEIFQRNGKILLPNFIDQIEAKVYCNEIAQKRLSNFRNVNYRVCPLWSSNIKQIRMK